MNVSDNRFICKGIIFIIIVFNSWYRKFPLKDSYLFQSKCKSRNGIIGRSRLTRIGIVRIVK